jgi:hypothetical protein
MRHSWHHSSARHHCYLLQFNRGCSSAPAIYDTNPAEIRDTLCFMSSMSTLQVSQRDGDCLFGSNGLFCLIGSHSLLCGTCHGILDARLSRKMEHLTQKIMRKNRPNDSSYEILFAEDSTQELHQVLSRASRLILQKEDIMTGLRSKLTFLPLTSVAKQSRLGLDLGIYL